MEYQVFTQEFAAWNFYSVFKKWSIRDFVLKKQREKNKRWIQQEFKKEWKIAYLYYIIKGSASTNDGNTARWFFSEIHTSAKITGLNKSLIKRFSVILQAISYGEIILENLVYILLKPPKN